ncbi:hypothetical protein HAX54_014779, partial [Datura stramonium]|nr:hypothetical protein [Datura stramonium]
MSSEKKCEIEIKEKRDDHEIKKERDDHEVEREKQESLSEDISYSNSIIPTSSTCSDSLVGTHEKVYIEEPSLDKDNPKEIETTCPMKQGDIDEDSYNDTPSLFDENEHDFDDSHIISFDKTRDFGGGLSQSESRCDSLTFDSPLLVDIRMKNCDQENFKNRGCKDKKE